MIFSAIIPFESGQKAMTENNVKFLDEWDNPSWLVAHPDFDGVEEFKKKLLAEYKTIITAWRKALDKDQSNRVSYTEFHQVARKVRSCSIILNQFEVVFQKAQLKYIISWYRTF